MSEKFKLSEFAPELDTPFVFNTRPIAISPDLRPEWKIAVTILSLKMCCRLNRSSYGRLHLLNWAVRTAATRDELRRTLLGITQPDSLLVRIEPSLNRAVNLGIGEGLLRNVDGNRIELTEAGKAMAEGILASKALFATEKEFFTGLRNKVTEELVTRLFKVDMSGLL